MMVRELVRDGSGGDKEAAGGSVNTEASYDHNYGLLFNACKYRLITNSCVSKSS